MRPFFFGVFVKWALDLEAQQWDKVTEACFVSEKGDVEHFAGPPESACTIEHAAEFVDKVGGTHFAHAGGIYDTLLISQAREKPWKEVIMSGSAVLQAKDGKTSIRDTFRAWLSGLKKVGKYLQKQDDERRAKFQDWQRSGCKGQSPELPHAEPGAWLKKDVDRTRLRLLSPAERRAYVESDTRILMEGIKAHEAYLASRKARTAWTAGSAAMRLLQRLEAPSWSILEQHRLDLETAIRAVACIRGARVETWALGKVEKVYCYDRKSAYPASYAFRRMPLGAVHVMPDTPEAKTPGTVWRCRWFWPWRGGETTLTDDRLRAPPVLDQVTGAGCGWCEAWLIPEEYDALSEWVAVRKIEGWAPETWAPIGQLFARDLFDEKERGSFFAKVFLNSLHGKLSETPIKESWTSGAEPTDYYGPRPELIGDYWHYLSVILEDDGKCPANVQPVAAAHVLGRARIALWHIIAKILKAGYSVYYCDTDCVHTNAPPEVMQRIFGDEYGVGLGQLAFEGGPYTCFYVGPKSYCALDEKGEVVKGACKGMPWESLKDGIVERSSLWGNFYRQARDEEKGSDLRLAVFDEALREYEGARIQKEGIATWKQGLRFKSGWSKFTQVRTLAPHERGKLFHRRAGPTEYAYQSPAELLIGRGVDLHHDPWQALTANPATDPFRENSDENPGTDIVDDLWGEQ